jgi:DNA repair exonuclease SbcCD nuclease subunit
MKKTLVIGDLHLGKMGYSDYIEDGRNKEKNDVFDFIVKKALLPEIFNIVFVGDQFNTKNPLSETVSELTRLLERIPKEKEVFIIAGNHEIKAGGETAIDYLKEITGKNWHVITDKPQKIGDMVFLPYQSKNFLNAEDNASAAKMIIESLPDGEVLFHHHAVKGSQVHGGMLVDLFPEPVLDLKALNKKYKLIVGGHIHSPRQKENVVVTGSVFNNEVGEDGKYIWTIDETLAVEKHPLPGRSVIKIENPTIEELGKLKKDTIIKAIISKKIEKEEKDLLKKELRKFDCYILQEQITNERKKVSLDDGGKITEMSIESLLGIYAKQNKIPEEKLLSGFELIKK